MGFKVDPDKLMPETDITEIAFLDMCRGIETAKRNGMKVIASPRLQDFYLMRYRKKAPPKDGAK